MEERGVARTRIGAPLGPVACQMSLRLLRMEVLAGLLKEHYGQYYQAHAASPLAGMVHTIQGLEAAYATEWEAAMADGPAPLSEVQ